MKSYASCVVLLALLACSKKDAAPAQPDNDTDVKPAVAVTPQSDAQPPATSNMIWVEEDYPKALSLARQRNLPIVIDSWAAWCHTCLDMDKAVLTEDALGAVVSEFIWLRMDRERPENAAVMAKFPVAVSPTYYVVDSKDEAVLGRLLGGASADEFKKVLANALAARGSQGTPENLADTLLVQGAQAAAAGNDSEAAALFQKARAAAPENWPRLPELLLSQLTQLYNRHDYQACADFALESLPLSTANPPSLGIMAFQAEMCARESKKPLATKVRKAIIAAVDKGLVSNEGGPLERSDALQMKRYALVGLGMDDQARANAEKERDVLDAAAASAGSPRDAMPFQIVAAEVYAFLGEQAAYVPVLEKAVADLPLEYHIKFLLAQLYYLDGRYDDARQKVERALELSYGPQRGIVHAFLADVYAALDEPEKNKRPAKRCWPSTSRCLPGRSNPRCRKSRAKPWQTSRASRTGSRSRTRPRLPDIDGVPSPPHVDRSRPPGLTPARCRPAWLRPARFHGSLGLLRWLRSARQEGGCRSRRRAAELRRTHAAYHWPLHRSRHR